MENFLNNNEIFDVDLTSFTSPADVVFELTHVLDDNRAFGKKISLKLANIDLSRAQLLSLKSLISSINSELYYIESPSSMTIASAQSIGIETPSNPPLKEVTLIETPTVEETPAQETIIAHDFTTGKDIPLSAQDEAKKYINLEMLNPQDETYKEFLGKEQKENDENAINEAQSQNENSGDYVIEEEVLEDFQDEHQEQENSDSSFENNQNFEQDEKHEEENFLNQIEQSVEFEELAQNSNVQTEVVQEALSGIYSTEKKLENILDNNTEQITVDLAEPLDTSYTEEDKAIDDMCVKYVKQTVRSGNVITSEGNLVIIGDCHPGSEIHAAGDITVWGMLGGIAHAGNKGNKRAKVRALKLNPIQLRIANLYTRRPDALHTIYNEKTSVFTPEEARIINEEIVIYTMNER